MSETIDRPKFREIRWGENREIPERFDTVQLKNGWYMGLHEGRTWTVGHILTHR